MLEGDNKDFMIGTVLTISLIINLFLVLHILFARTSIIEGVSFSINGSLYICESLKSGY